MKIPWILDFAVAIVQASISGRERLGVGSKDVSENDPHAAVIWIWHIAIDIYRAR
jgi:hypothetical protein